LRYTQLATPVIVLGKSLDEINVELFFKVPLLGRLLIINDILLSFGGTPDPVKVMVLSISSVAATF
jgi:hypothetical protein